MRPLPIFPLAPANDGAPSADWDGHVARKLFVCHCRYEGMESACGIWGLRARCTHEQIGLGCGMGRSLSILPFYFRRGPVFDRV